MNKQINTINQFQNVYHVKKHVIILSTLTPPTPSTWPGSIMAFFWWKQRCWRCQATLAFMYINNNTYIYIYSKWNNKAIIILKSLWARILSYTNSSNQYKIYSEISKLNATFMHNEFIILRKRDMLMPGLSVHFSCTYSSYTLYYSSHTTSVI